MKAETHADWIRIKKTPGHDFIEDFIEDLYKNYSGLARRAVKVHLLSESPTEAYIRLDVLPEEPNNEIDAKTITVGTVVDVAHCNMTIKVKLLQLSGIGGNHVRVKKTAGSVVFSPHVHDRSNEDSYIQESICSPV